MTGEVPILVEIEMENEKIPNRNINRKSGIFLPGNRFFFTFSAMTFSCCVITVEFNLF